MLNGCSSPRGETRVKQEVRIKQKMLESVDVENVEIEMSIYFYTVIYSSIPQWQFEGSSGSQQGFTAD